MGIGIGFGPNGQIGPVITFDNPGPSSPPSEYESWFETPEGVKVKVSYFTSNQILADQYQASLLKHMKWTISESKPREESLVMDLLLAWTVAFFIALALAFVVFIGSEIFLSADFLSYDSAHWIESLIPRWGIYCFGLTGFSMSLYSIVECIKRHSR